MFLRHNIFLCCEKCAAEWTATVGIYLSAPLPICQFVYKTILITLVLILITLVLDPHHPIFTIVNFVQSEETMSVVQFIK